MEGAPYYQDVASAGTEGDVPTTFSGTARWFLRFRSSAFEILLPVRHRS